jgi:ribosomal protein L23
MSKSIELTASQIKARENGATMFLVAIAQDKQEICRCAKDKDEFIRNYSPLQKGDKDVWIKEEFIESPVLTTKSEYHEYGLETSSCLGNYVNWKPASQMTKEQSRYSFKEILDVRVVRVQDICAFDFFFGYCSFEESNGVGGFNILYNINGDEYDESTICDFYEEYYNQQMQEQNINRTYEDNDYTFLVETKSTKV